MVIGAYGIHRRDEHVHLALTRQGRQPFGASAHPHDPGRLGRILRRCARWCAEYLPFSRTLERGRCSCACGLCCAVAVRWLLVARLMHVLASPVEPADGLGRFGCVRAEMGAIVYDMFCGSFVLWNAGVRGARLLLAVARGAQKCVGRIRAELWSSVDP